ncbi:F0F1 ATP synthase subunit B family protein [Ruoffia tabacinasalis]|uniref:F0F1 ATP synthase subunit B family protein n=1 Tax=Ruoffia tabacinasalis TaxID=87458 RepID=UPI003F97DFD3
MNNLIILSTQAVPEGRVFGLDGQTLIQIGVQLLNGIILAIVLTYVLYKPVKSFLDKRTNSIETDIEHAERMSKEADATISEYNKKIEDIEEERLKLLDESRAQADEERKEVLKRAQVEADDIKSAALLRISADRARMEEEMRLQSIEMANLMASQYLSEQMDDEAQSEYFEKMLSRMEETSWSK